MFPVTSLPENSNDSAGSSEMMSSMILAMTTVSLGVAARAGPASRTIAATSQVTFFMNGSFRLGLGPGSAGRRRPEGPGPCLTHDRGGRTACQARATPGPAARADAC